eukprot:TRINITY_DN1491_c0_g1_i3.p1 TRINITY_DN1491_c0_g1~~TRINITY_DN1491_c0_g1_i3.p1  ORF type:complete len:371 (-),score=94.94 TRINITY_DN1491_c0_g1_i3:77-1189(-)
MLVDTTNNILFSRVSRWQLDGPAPITNQTIAFPVVASLVYYDLAKNYTWDSANCSCTGITGTNEMPLLSVPPFASFMYNSSDGINQGNGQGTGIVFVYNASYTFGSFVNPLGYVNEGGVNAASAAVSTNLRFYVDNNNFTRRVEFDVVVPDTPQAQNVTILIDLWDPSEVKDNNLVLPDTSCKNKCAVNGMIVAGTPETCAVPAKQCVCTNSTSLPYCNSTAVYAVSSTIFQDDADATAKASVEAVVAAVNAVKDATAISDACQAELKSFMCGFYLPQCTGDNSFLKPNISVVSCLSALNDAQRQAAYQASGAFSVYRVLVGDTTSYPSPYGIQGWQIAVIVLVSAALIAGIVFALWQRSQSKRADYQAV